FVCYLFCVYRYYLLWASSCLFRSVFLFIYSYDQHEHLHSFPTRRSSDLLSRGLAVFSVMMAVFCSLIIFLFIFTDMMITGLIALTNKLPENISYMNTVLLEKGQALYEELLAVFPFFEKFALTEYFN